MFFNILFVSRNKFLTISINFKSIFLNFSNCQNIKLVNNIKSIGPFSYICTKCISHILKICINVYHFIMQINCLYLLNNPTFCIKIMVKSSFWKCFAPLGIRSSISKLSFLWIINFMHQLNYRIHQPRLPVALDS